MISVYGHAARASLVLTLALALAGCAEHGDGDSSSATLDAGGDGDFYAANAGDGDGDGDLFARDGSDDGGVERGTDVEPVVLASNPFVYASHDPFSTFGADVDSASYDIFRREAHRALRPRPEQVRVEDFVNFFAYDYPAPAADSEAPFSISLEGAPSVFDRGTVTVRVGIQGKEPPALEKKPANVVFLVDVSGSMDSPEKLPVAQHLLERALLELEPTDTVSVVSYAGDTQVRLPPTAVEDTAKIRDVIDGLGAAGGTNGESGIRLAYQQARSGFIEGGINHVVLCTDGDFNLGVTTTRELIDLITEQRMTGVTLTALGFGRDELNDGMMEAVSNAGNGIYSVITDRANAERYAAEKLLATLVLIARDVKLQVEWNPELVTAYRLIGYENRAIADDDFRDDLVDAGEIGSGHRVTALYEIVLAGGELPNADDAPEAIDGPEVPGPREIRAGELVRVKVRYKAPLAGERDPASEVAQVLMPSALRESFSAASDDARFAMAVAAWAELLKGSPFASDGVLSTLDEVFSSEAARDADRAELEMLFQAVR
jgi:Ca-activated chloride channel family protein